jgi:hypothetical protein
MHCHMLLLLLPLLLLFFMPGCEAPPAVEC